MDNLEPIEEKDLDLESKFKKEQAEKALGEKPEQPAFKIEKEAVRESSVAEKDNIYSKILSKVQQQPAGEVPHEEIKKDAEEVHNKTDAESQIQNLVDIALNKGVIHAVKVARHLEDNYVLDMFHDKLLADELHDALIKKGLIKNI